MNGSNLSPVANLVPAWYSAYGQSVRERAGAWQEGCTQGGRHGSQYGYVLGPVYVGPGPSIGRVPASTMEARINIINLVPFRQKEAISWKTAKKE